MKFPTFYKSQRFVTVFTSAHHLSLSQATLIQFMQSHPISLTSISILSSYLCLGLPSGLPPSDFAIRTPECISFLSHMCYMFHSSQPHWDMWQAIQNIKLPNMLFSPVSCPSSLLATDIFLPPNSSTMSTCVLLLKWQTKFHTHVKQPAKLQFCIS